MVTAKEKYIGIAAIVAFAVIFFFGFAVSFLTPIIQKQKAEQEQHEKQAKQFKARADSITRVMVKKLDSVVEEYHADSTTYTKEKQQLQIQFIKQKKGYEALLHSVDTLSDSAFNSGFSIRKMLSDSTCALYR